MGTLHEDMRAFMIISGSVLIIMRNIKKKIVEKMKTHILCSVRIFFPQIAPFMR